MINKLISLPLLIFFLTSTNSYSEDKFLFPKKKPSVFKKIEKNISSTNIQDLPQRKPIIQSEVKKDIIIEKKKTSVKKVEPKIKSIEKKKKKRHNFYFQRKNQLHTKFNQVRLKNQVF